MSAGETSLRLDPKGDARNERVIVTVNCWLCLWICGSRIVFGGILKRRRDRKRKVVNYFLPH